MLLTLLMVCAALPLGWFAWRTYMTRPWTRDGQVRAYVVTMAPQVAGLITELPVKDDQFVHAGDLLMVIDPTDYAIAVSEAQARLAQAAAMRDSAAAVARRRADLSDLSTSREEKQTTLAQAQAAQAAYQQAAAALGHARVNLERTRIVSPVNGWVTNLQAQLGDYADVGQRNISIVNADSFWVDGYFQETVIAPIRVGDPARVKLLGFRAPIAGHVAGIARGIEVANAQSDPAGLAMVNPIFTWVRLAQRVPVRIALDKVPASVRLVVGETATVEVFPAERAKQQARVSLPDPSP